MNKFFKIIIGLNILLFSLNINSANATKENNLSYQTESESFLIPGHGELIMDVPKVWNYNFTTSENTRPPIITFYNLDKDKEEIYQLNLSVLWDNGFGRNILSSKYIYSLVEETGKQALLYSDQSELILEKIIGKNGVGYWFNLSDSTAGPGEYKFLTQGALAVGKLLLIFSLFSNDNESILQQALLKIIISAQHHYRKDV
tara:strand:+ start:86 stop:688 length:603 start_codon:yes stop_codon:yes gene_type:complete